jgi:hypothetical protein
MRYDVLNQPLSKPTICGLLKTEKHHKLILHCSGCEENPSVTFNDSMRDGWYLNKCGQIAMTVDGSTNIVYTNTNTEFKSPIMFSNVDDVLQYKPGMNGILFKKTNDTGLYWRTSDGDIDIANNRHNTNDITDNNNTLNNTLNNTIYEKDGEVYWRNGSSSLCLSVTEFVGGLLHNPLLAASGTVKSPGISFAVDPETGFRIILPNILSYTCGGKDRVLFTEDSIQVSSGSAISPSYSFIDDTTTGTHLYVKGEQRWAVSGVDQMSLTTDRLQLDTVLEFIDQSDSGEVSEKTGRLFKKTNDDNLYWRTSNGEVSITDIGLQCPLYISDDGSASVPSYSFESSKQSGLYIKDGNLAVSSGSMDSAVFKQGRIILGSNGQIKLPGYGFASNEKSGLSLVDDSVVTSVNGDQSLSVSLSGVSSVFGYTSIIDGSYISPAYNFSSGRGGMSLVNDGIVISGQHIDLVAGSTVGLVINSDGPIIPVNRTLQFDTENTAVNVNVNNAKQLTSSYIGMNRTYCSSEMFTADNRVRPGDIVGVCDNGNINKVLGGKWDQEVHISNTNSCSSSVLWDSFSNTVDLHMYTRSRVMNNPDLSILTMHVTTTLAVNNLNTSLNTTSIDLTSVLVPASNPKAYSSVIVKIGSDNRYVVIYGEYNNMTLVTLKKFRITVDDDKPTIHIESTLEYHTVGVIETFDCVYEDSGSLDILVLVMYSEKLNNMESALFSVSPDSDKTLILGYNSAEISIHPIIGSNKTMRAVLIPGQVVICSYANNKTFILLPSEYTDVFNVCDTIMDNDSADCIDIIYDMINAVIITVERTFSDVAFLQVIDIFGTKIDILRSKRLGSNTIIPIGLGYNDRTDNFMLFYADSAVSGQIKTQTFTHDGEQIKLNMSYSRGTDSNRYNPEEIDGVTLPNHGKRVWSRTNGIQTICWPSANRDLVICNFNDSYGIQADAFIGIAMGLAQTGDVCEVCYKGQIYYNEIGLSRGFIGKKLYLNSNKIMEDFPNNLTTNAMGNVFIGTCVAKNRILVGL